MPRCISVPSSSSSRPRRSTWRLRCAGTDQVQAVSSHVMFLARGKVGPFRADAEPVTGSDGVTAVRMVLHDEGDGDRAVTAGSYQFRIVD